MRFSVLAAIAVSSVASACVFLACSSDSNDAPGEPNAEGGSSSGSTGSSGGSSGGPLADGGTDGSSDGAMPDGDSDVDGAETDGGVDSGTPAVAMIGRFAPDGANAYFAYPGSKLIARFNGTDATVTFSQADGFSNQGHSWFDLTIDGVAQTPFEVNGTSVAYPVATNLTAGVHTVELEKRTEANLGVVHYEGFTFPNGGTLLSPPARPTRRIEILSDSTIDGFGIDGTRVTAGAANYCGPGASAPAQFDNSKESTAEVTAAALSAESFLIAYSGKGLTVNEGGPSDTLYFPTLYNRTLPDNSATTWNFSSWIPDAVVLSIGGEDFDGQTSTPTGFDAAYGGLVDTIRGHYPNAWIFLTVWSQIKDEPILTRTAMKSALNAIVTERAGDMKLEVFTFPESDVDTDETGCEYHATATFEASMATLLETEMKAKLGW